MVEGVGMEALVLQGGRVRLEPLAHRHIDGLVAAAAVDPSLYQWSPVPQGRSEVADYVDTALAWRDAGSAVPFAIVRIDEGLVIGSTRFWNLERWSWPEGHPSRRRAAPDACEIGYTWLRVCFHTDARNQRSRAALERIGGRFEGILRAHRMAADYTARDSVRYSIIASEWPAVKLRLLELMERA